MHMHKAHAQSTCTKHMTMYMPMRMPMRMPIPMSVHIPMHMLARRFPADDPRHQSPNPGAAANVLLHGKPGLHTWRS